MGSAPEGARLRHAATQRAPRRTPAHARPAPDDARLEKLLLADLAPPDLLMRALHCADVQGVTALDALIACTNADTDDVAARLARRLGVAILSEGEDIPANVLSATAASAAVQIGIFRLPGGRFVVSLRGRPVVELARLLSERPDLAGRVLLATPAAFSAALLRASGREIARESAGGPVRIDPLLSAQSRRLPMACAMGAGVIGICAVFAALSSSVVMSLVLGAVFMMLTALRLFAARPDRPDPALPRLPDDLLPVYTVLVPLFREPACAPSIVDALKRLDYPEAKLDIKFLVETGDCETLEALQACAPPNRFEIVVVPPGAPRTKPRALNTGLALARGSLLAVFDAEDRPEPGQLRAAVNAFIRGGPRLACVQARLVIDNISDGWLTRIFALEYAGLFDVLLPALSRSGLFFPLGGTSNHFRTAALDRIGGWDAWNVTEDADLGVRLARMGYGLKVIASSTLEEAPNRTGAWVRQRTRWLKGFMLTWAVHMRRPWRLYRQLGLVNFLAFQAFIGAVPVSALILPIFLVGIAFDAMSGEWLSLGPSFLVECMNLIVGFSGAMALSAIGADRRGLTGLTFWIATVPFYWLLSSLAAWRAVWQLARTPFLWEKTEHGLARTSRAAGTAVKAPGEPHRRSRYRAASY